MSTSHFFSPPFFLEVSKLFLKSVKPTDTSHQLQKNKTLCKHTHTSMLALSISTTTMSELILPQFSSSTSRIETDSVPVLPRFVSNNEAEHDADQRMGTEYPKSIAEISFVHRSSSAFQRITGVGATSQVC